MAGGLAGKRISLQRGIKQLFIENDGASTRQKTICTLFSSGLLLVIQGVSEYSDQ